MVAFLKRDFASFFDPLHFLKDVLLKVEITFFHSRWELNVLLLFAYNLLHACIASWLFLQ